ncbi:DUF2157 domain-containing protein [Microbacterium sp. 4R-513]|uniref:DUF2157 domain-containing protein n=1 Tax=Microbacterium sp. 4R-513 TaxID=2567934 RepID=UPI0013E10C5C|nr:DUF2157 domain-containing protein [Microbacterium sp. 4R-513]QIG39030.1 DUF2157 domain-containing protein [Microbacterium sp. 4R-513]
MSKTIAPRWPGTPEMLADPHLCPVCFEDVRPPACPVCGFSFTDPRAADVLSFGRRMLELETERRQTIDAVQLTAVIAARRAAASARAAAEQAAARAVQDAAALAAQPAKAPVSAEPAPVPPPGAPAPVVPAAAPDMGDWPPPAVPPADVVREPRRRLSVPVLLLIVGVSLVGIAAVFFLLLAWFVAGISVRALIIGGITLGAMAAASWLRRRSLTATAEGIAVLGVILLALDAWAMRANDLFGAGAVDAAIYAGSSLLAVAVLCRAWAVVSRLRSPDLAAALALPAGLGLLVSGLVSADPAESLVAGLLGASVGGLAHALPAPWSSARRGPDALPERVALAFLGVVSLAAAAITPAVAEVGTATLVWSTVVVVVLGLAHAWALRARAGLEPLPGAQVLIAISSSLAVAAAGTMAWQLAWRTGEPVYSVLIAPVAAVTVAVAMDRLRSRRGGLAAPAITATVVAGLSVVAMLIRFGLEAQGVISASWSLWRTDAFAFPADPPELTYPGLLAAVVIAAGLFLAPTLGGPVLRDIRPVVAVLLVVTGTARTGVPGIAVGTAIAAVAFSIVVLRRSGAAAGWTAAAAVAAVLGFALSTATPWLWFVMAAVAIGAPIARRFARTTSPDWAAALAVMSPVVATVSAVIAPAPLGVVLGTHTVAGGVAPGTTVVLVQWVAVATLVAALALRLDRLSRSALVICAEALLAITLVGTVALASAASYPGDAADVALQASLGEPAFAIARGALLAAGSIAVVMLRDRVAPVAALGASVLVAPTLAAAAHAALRAWAPVDAPWTPLVLLSTTILVVVVSAWLGLTRRLGEASGRLRLSAEIGAIATAFVVASPVGAQQAWAAWVLVAVGFGATAVTHGLADVETSPEDDVFAARMPGARTSEAPRRLLVWPAAAAAIVAWWSWLGAGTPDLVPTVETAAVPVGVALVGLAAALVWLRRRVEASVALGVGLAIGLGAPALESSQGPELRGMLVAVVAAVICLALSFRPLGRVRPASPLGAAVGIVVVGLVTVQRTLTGGATDAAWLLLLLATALAAAFAQARVAPERLSSRLFAEGSPAAAVIAAAVTIGFTTDRAGIVALALGVLAAVHVASAAVGRLPFGTLTRWSALAGALFVATTALTFSVVTEVEAATLPVAGTVLAGAAAAAVRSRRRAEAWPIVESVVWTAGLVLATAPSVLAPVEPARAWLFLAAALAAAAAASALPIPAEWRIRVPSALVLAGAALAMGARALTDPLLASADAAAATAGAGAVAIAIVLASTAAAERTAWHPIVLAGAGAALLDVVVLLRFDGALAPAAVAAVVGGAVAIVGASTLGIVRWRGIGAVLALGGLVLSLAVCAIRFGVVAAQPGLEADVWALVGAAITTATVIAAVRAVPRRAMALTGAAVLAGATVLFTGGEAVLLALQDGFDDVRALLVMSILTAAAVAGMFLRQRFGRAMATSAIFSAGAFGLLAIFGFGITPVELVTVPPALGGLGYGAWALRRRADARSWPLLGPWIVLLTVPSLLHDLGESELWRVVALGIVALALVVAGAAWRRQAPLVLGSAVLLVHAVAQLWPWISAVYVAVPWWLWLGIGGALLIFLAATYERRVRQMRAAFVSVGHLR